MSEKTLLEVGDEIYSHEYGKWSGPIVITRVTKARAFTHIKTSGDGYEKCFQREVGKGGYVVEVPRPQWPTRSYQLLDSDEKEKAQSSMRYSQRLATIKSADWHSLGSEIVEQVYGIYVAAKKGSQTSEPGEEE